MIWFRKKEIKITYAADSRQGGRDYNEDSVFAVGADNRFLFVLADGLGGCGHGELASGTAVKRVAEEFQCSENEDFLDRAFEGAQEAVLMKQKENVEARTMATTLVVLEIREGLASWAHIGDSRLYWFRRGRVAAQTLDHSVPQMLVHMGEIKPEEIRHHPDRSRLLHIIGREYSEKHYQIVDPVKIRRGDAFLLCSDGFWEHITEEKMCEMLVAASDVQEWLNLMQEEVEKNGIGESMDNYSAVCVKVI